jgi:hypothetical protein
VRADGRILRAAACAIVGMAIAIPSGARELSVHDRDLSFALVGLAIRVEAVVHRGERLLLLRIGANATRSIALGSGRFDAVAVDDRRHAFLPTSIDCAGVRVESGGKTLSPTLVSPCSDVGRITTTGAMPVFVALPWPAGRSASISVPVTVHAPGPPVRRSLHQSSSYTPAVDASLIGARTLRASVLVDDPKQTTAGTTPARR